ncbi:MAG: hypothetical protein KF712_07580 [Akkermansiaceae bacterium]|nr:hypothetical protein [Akkermansiaceae bacterium]
MRFSTSASCRSDPDSRAQCSGDIVVLPQHFLDPDHVVRSELQYQLDVALPFLFNGCDGNARQTVISCQDPPLTPIANAAEAQECASSLLTHPAA